MKRFASDQTISQHISQKLREKEMYKNPYDIEMFANNMMGQSKAPNPKNVFQRTGDFDEKSKFMRISKNLPIIPDYAQSLK